MRHLTVIIGVILLSLALIRISQIEFKCRITERNDEYEEVRCEGDPVRYRQYFLEKK